MGTVLKHFTAASPSEEYIVNVMAPYGPQSEVARLVPAVNKIYHAFEARDYDRRHPEIAVQLPPIWKKMVAYITSHAEPALWHILDFGCGTGFEAEQLLRNIPREKIGGLVCYDPSPQMLEHCRARIAPLFPGTVFFDDLDLLIRSHERTANVGAATNQKSGGNEVSPGIPGREIPAPLSSNEDGMFNLLATNSLLHHLPNPVQVINSLLLLLSEDAFWIAGHEPSSRFYANRECLAVFEAFRREQLWKRFFAPGTYITRLEMALGRRSNPAHDTAREAQRQGLFLVVPPAWIIERLVDYHLAYSASEVASGRGLEFKSLERDFAGAWSLRWLDSYAYIGPYYEGNLPPKWSRVCRDLRRKYPLDGANFCTIWSRSQEVRSET